MAVDYQDFCKTGIEFSSYKGLQKLCDDLADMKVVLVMSQTAVERYSLFNFIEHLRLKCNNLLWIAQAVTYPTQETILMGLREIKDFDADVIVSIGGGSSIDFAKALKAFYYLKNECTIEKLTELLLTKNICAVNKALRLIAIPTTAGTGAELTQWATIWDYRKECKFSIDASILKPDKAIIIPQFTLKADEKLTIATGVDSLSHAIEAYWSKKTNMLVRSLAGEAVRIIVKNLPLIMQEPEELIYRKKQCLASVLAGLAFSMTRTTACHSISYPLTMNYGILHGIASAMTLEQVSKRNSGQYVGEKELLEYFAEFNGIDGFLHTITAGKIGLCLKNYGIKKNDLSTIAQKSFTLGRMDNNPVKLSVMDVQEILLGIYDNESK